MAKKQTKTLQDIHYKARTDFDRIQAALRSEREQCLEDRRFYSIAGAMWEGDLGEQFTNKPRYEINKIHLSVIKIINEYRNNRITVKFIPKDGSKNDVLSDTLNGLFRADEQDSVADEAYDNAFEEGVGGGIGGWRLHNAYEDELDDENDYQRIKITPIFDADTSIYFDTNAKRYDKSDARYCYVLKSMDRADYIYDYDDDPDSWDKTVEQNEFDWDTPDIVYIAEYYKVEETTENRQVWQDISGKETVYSDKDFEENPDLERKLTAVGGQKIRDKKVKIRKVHKYLMSGGKILEDYGYIAGSNIPIVPYFGKRWFVDNIERAMGHVRLCKDAQRLKNMQTSKLAEISTYSSIEKPIVSPEQIMSHQTMWEEDNIKNYPYLLLNTLTDKEGNDVATGPLGYTRVPQIPPAMAALLQLTDADMQQILGNQQVNEDIPSNISGKAVELIQNRLDMQTYIYMSNMAKSMQRCGEIWLGMAKEVYVEPSRTMKTVQDNDKVGMIEISRPVQNPETEEIEYENDISGAKMGVSVSVGPSSDSKRASTVRALTQMISLSTDPTTQKILTSMAMMNMEGEGVEDVRDYFRRELVMMGAVKPTEEEQEVMQAQAQQNAQPDANEQLLLSAAAEAQSKAKKAEAEVFKTVAQTQQIQADTEKTRVETIETLQDIQTAGAVQPTVDNQQ